MSQPIKLTGKWYVSNYDDMRANVNNRQALEWREAAARCDRVGLPVTALLFRNEAYRIEQEAADIGKTEPVAEKSAARIGRTQ